MAMKTCAAMLLAGVLALPAGLAAAQQSRQLPDRTIPGLQDRDSRPAQMPDRTIPTLQDRSQVDDAPPVLRDEFAAFCRQRGGCPGGYVQHGGEFAITQQQQQIEERRRLERDLQQLQQGVRR